MLAESPLAPAGTRPAAPGPASAPRRRRSPGTWLSVLPAAVVVLLVLAWLVAPAAFTGYDPLTGDSSATFAPPSATHLFGTDHLGRDVLTRVIWGTRQTALTAGLAVVVGLALGVVVGVASATLGPVADALGMRLVDVLIALPSIMVALFVVTAYGAGPLSIGVGVGIGSVVLFARVVRAEVLRVRSLDFVEASTLAGAGYWRQLLGHVLPALWGPVLALAVVDAGHAVLAVSSLGYLGFGTPPPTPEWGYTIAEGRQYLHVAWWMTTLPGLFIVAVVVSLGVIGRTVEGATRA